MAAPTIFASGVKSPRGIPSRLQLCSHTASFTPAFTAWFITSLSEGKLPSLIFSASPFLTSVIPFMMKYTVASMSIIAAVVASMNGAYVRSGWSVPLVWMYSIFFFPDILFSSPILFS